MKDYSKAAAMLKEFEGNVTWMYLDTRGYVTVGVGEMIPTAAAARHYPFYHRAPKSGQRATAAEIEAEFKNVHSAQKGHVSSYYHKNATLEMHQGDIDDLLMKQIKSFETRLRGHFPQFDSYPEPVQRGLLDMAYNLGIGKLVGHFPSFCKAVKERDWKTAAAQSHRNGPSAKRNNQVKQMFLDAAAKDTAAPEGFTLQATGLLP